MRSFAPRIDVHIDHVAEIGDVRVEKIVLVRRRGLARALASGMRFTPARLAASSSLASVLDPAGDRRVSAGPPFGGLYLKPPSVGRIVRRRDDDAVRQPVLCGRGCRRGSRARSPGVGVYSSPAAIITSTPLAASTSSALANAGADSACVSMPRNSGPAMPCCLRYSQIAWRDGEDVRFVEAALERAAAMARRAERHALRADAAGPAARCSTR